MTEPELDTARLPVCLPPVSDVRELLREHGVDEDYLKITVEAARAVSDIPHRYTYSNPFTSSKPIRTKLRSTPERLLGALLYLLVNKVRSLVLIHLAMVYSSLMPSVKAGDQG